MRTQSKIRRASKSLVLAYVHHVRKRVREGDFSYISLGIDTNFRLYEALFSKVLAKTLNLQYRVTLDFSDLVVNECVEVLTATIATGDYHKLLSSELISECVFDVCKLIISQVSELETYKSKGKGH